MRPGFDVRTPFAFPRRDRPDPASAAANAATNTLFIEAARSMRALIDSWLDLWLKHPLDIQHDGNGLGLDGQNMGSLALDGHALDGHALDGQNRHGGDAVITAVAHELRTPLTTIRSISEILQDNPDLTPDQRDQFLGALVQESERLQRSIDRMLEASSANPDRWCVETARLQALTPASPTASLGAQ
jgi:signal transduction histidine kinase